MSINNTRNSLMDTDWFDINFLGSFLNDNHKVKKFLNEPRYHLADEKISSRILNDWHNAGILEDNRTKKQGWRKFSFSEVIWISVILKLRGFGMDFKKITRVKEYLTAYSSEKNESQFPELDFYIAHCISSKMPIKLLVFDTGEVLLGRQNAIDIAFKFNGIKDDFISIDIAKLINSRFKGKQIQPDYLDYSLTNIEKEVQKSIYFDDVKSLTLTIKDDKEILLSKEHIRNSKNEIKALLEKVGDYYEESSVKKGKNKHYKLIEKKKVNK